ncbi:MAG: demethylmenaquinone methyltransferase [Isosphaeraceae bacterium]|nr:MAG: demethylmenaquinone methyltransferase [Isosphaeraceae bacterium]
MAGEVIESVPESAELVDKTGPRVRRMFGAIAPRYDLLNHLLSLNIDRRWRAYTVRRVPPRAGEAVLDCCTGTADLALAYDRAARGGVEVIGTDFCRPMLEIGWRKVRKARATGRMRLIEADTQRLPFADDTFGVVTVAFGLRNVSDTRRGLAEMIRVARPGGRVAILEFSRPRTPVLGRLYLAFFRHVLPRVGEAMAPNRDGAYAYLPASVLQFPEGAEMVALMEESGLVDVEAERLTLGVATLYVGTKPPRGSDG